MRPVHWLYTIPMRLRSLFRWAQADQELDDELREHLERKTEEYVAQGMTQEEAHRRVRLELGGIEQTKEKCRDARRVNWIQDFVQDLRFGLRILRKSPGFTAAVVLTLALGIGATTAIFTLIDAVMLKSLPVANPKQLYRLGDNNNCCVMVGTQNSGSFVLYSHPLYEYLRDSTPEFSELAAFEPWTSDLSVRRSGSAAEPYKGEFVSGNYFNTLGIPAFAGRLLTPSDDSVSAPRVAVMNYHTWQRHFGLDPSVIGSTLNINGVPCAIAGVTPPGFYGDTLRSDPADFWLPLVAEPRHRLIRQMLTESALLAVAGGAVGLYVAYAGTRAILLLAFRGANYVPIDARPSLPVLGFAVLLSLVTGIVFGIAPAWTASQSSPIDALRGSGRSAGDRSSMLQKSLVIAQVVFSIVLLIAAGLVTQSLRNLEDQNFGFVTEGRLIVNIDPSLAGYTPDKLHGLYH